MKKVFSIAIVLILFYFGTLILFGRNQLSTQLSNNSNSSYAEFRWTNNVNIIGNLNLDKIAEIFNQKDVTIKLNSADKFDGFEDIFFRKNNYNYVLIADPFYYPYVEVKESENFREYVADWGREYLWCFFFWIETRNELTGIS